MEWHGIRAEVRSPDAGRGRLRFLKLTYRPATGIPGGVEIGRLERAIKEVLSELELATEFLQKQKYEVEAAILQAHLLLLRDEELLYQVRNSILISNLTSEDDLESAMQRMSIALKSSGSALLAERAADLKDLQLRIGMKLAEVATDAISPGVADWNQAVVAMEELLPSSVLAASKAGVRSFVMDRGTQLSHPAIMARSFGISVLKIASLGSSISATMARLLSAREITEAERKAAQNAWPRGFFSSYISITVM